MSLADIIAAKKTGCGEATNRPIASLSAPPSPAIVDDSDCFTLVKIEQPDIPEIKIYEAKNYIEPNEELFVAAWTPFLLHPYTFEPMTCRSYIKWLLSPSIYVLGAFPRIDSQLVFQTYMDRKPPASIRDSYLLSQLCWEIDLHVPAKYESSFIDIIQKNFP